VVHYRQTLLEVAAAGPAAGAAASLACLLLGLGLSAAGFGGIEVEPSAFEDSLLVGLLGKPEHNTLPGNVLLHACTRILCSIACLIACSLLACCLTL